MRSAPEAEKVKIRLAPACAGSCCFHLYALPGRAERSLALPEDGEAAVGVGGHRLAL